MSLQNTLDCLRIVEEGEFASKKLKYGIKFNIPVDEENHKFKVHNFYDISFPHKGKIQPAIAIHVSEETTGDSIINQVAKYKLPHYERFDNIKSKIVSIAFNHLVNDLIVVILNEKINDFKYYFLDELIDSLKGQTHVTLWHKEGFKIPGFKDSILAAPKEAAGGVIIGG